ncbi:hypothetical protein [Streptomyces sp. TLI_105]|nr:hypothetical protein [Streptomyces sp. TLI_105]
MRSGSSRAWPPLRAGHGAQQLPRRVAPRILDALAEPLGETGLTEGS